MQGKSGVAPLAAAMVLCHALTLGGFYLITDRMGGFDRAPVVPPEVAATPEPLGEETSEVSTDEGRKCCACRQAEMCESKLKDQGTQFEADFCGEVSITPVSSPSHEGQSRACTQPPTDQEILRAMHQDTCRTHGPCEECRDDISIVKERIVDRVHPPRMFPLVGMAQLHHCQWKCTVHFTETIKSDSFFPVVFKKRRTEVVYIDKDSLRHHSGEVKIMPRAKDDNVILEESSDRSGDASKEWQKLDPIQGPHNCVPQRVYGGIGS